MVASHSLVRPAFTLIEMMYAITIALIVLAVSIPQFSSLQQRQELNLDLQSSIVKCLQEAQNTAQQGNKTVTVSGVSGIPIRWVAADVNFLTGVCQVGWLPSAGVTTLTSTVTLLTTDDSNTSLPTIPVFSGTFTGAEAGDRTPDPATQITKIRLYFGTTEHGAPVRYVMQDHSGHDSDYTPAVLGQGFWFAIGAKSSNGKIVTAVTVGTQGVPIRVERLNIGS